MIEGLLKRIVDILDNKITVIQDAKDRTITGTATVTQVAKDRTITGTATVTQVAKDRTITPFDTSLSSAITLIIASTAYHLPSTPQTGRKMLVVYNTCDHTIYIGHSGVSSSNGLPVLTKKHIVIGASTGIYALCVTGGVVINILELK